MATNRHAHNALIDRIGGEKVSGYFSLSPQALYAWRKRGIPVPKRIAFAKLAAEHGVPMPSDFFDQFEGRAA